MDTDRILIKYIIFMPLHNSLIVTTIEFHSPENDAS